MAITINPTELGTKGSIHGLQRLPCFLVPNLTLANPPGINRILLDLRLERQTLVPWQAVMVEASRDDVLWYTEGLADRARFGAWGWGGMRDRG